MKLLNIHNRGKNIYLFCRNDDGQQVIVEDNDFYPYYYEPDANGEYLSFDNKALKKVLCSLPSDIAKQRSNDSYESDIVFTKRYMIDKIPTIEEAPIKYLFLDIETLSPELPNVEEAKYPISCITIYNSFSKETKTFYLGDYSTEEQLHEDFISYIKTEKPDLLLAWNIDNFDYPYLQNRIEDFAKRISPIGQIRYGKDGMFYPAGISVVDYLWLFKKVYMREQSYKLDHVAEKHLKAGKKNKEVDFSKLSPTLKERNKEDVEILVKLEEKTKLIPYYNEVRMLSCCLWEDLYYNSRIIDTLLLKEAKVSNIILPKNNKGGDNSSFKGATRDLSDTGIFRGIGKYDLSGAYPSMIVNFCLDSSNIVDVPNENSINVNGINFNQNNNTLLPKVVKKMLTLKEELGKSKKNADVDSKEYEGIKARYDGIKGIVNSTFGVFGNQYFRMYDQRITASITYLARELLIYVKDTLNSIGHKVIYFDTDSIFAKSDNNIKDLLNNLIQEWAKKQGKDSIDLLFEYEGTFNRIFLLGKCHYLGYIEGKEKPEIKGIEAKRASSSKYEATFQRTLIDKTFDELKAVIVDWIKAEKKRLKTLPFEEMAFPCKIQHKVYKNEPIFVRAYNNTKLLIPKFKVEKGELFYYIFVKSLGTDANGKDINVLAFNDTILDAIKVYKDKIDWDEVYRRSIITKADAIFNAMGWNLNIELSNQLTLF